MEDKIFAQWYKAPLLLLAEKELEDEAK